MNFDEILEHIGEFGPWQVLLTLALWIPSMSSGIYVMNFSFVVLLPERYRCKLDYCDSANATFGDFGNNSWIFETDNDGNPNYCQYRTTLENASTGQYCDDESFFSDSFSKCTSDKDVLYDSFDLDNSMATDFNLICNDYYKVALLGALQMTAQFFGSFLVGVSSDRYGRKPTLFFFIILGATGSLLGSFCDSYVLYAFTRMAAIIGGSGAFIIPFTLLMELVGPKYKTMEGILINVPFAIGEAFVALIAYFIRDWRKMNIAVSAPNYLPLLLIFFIPESPRWLIAKGKYEKAKSIIKTGAKFNKKTFPSKFFESTSVNTVKSDDQRETKQLGIKDMFKEPKVLRITLIMFVNWMMVTLGYYGITMNSVSIGNNVFVSYGLSALIEIPSYIYAYAVLDFWGRKPVLSTSMLLCGVATIVAGFLESGSIEQLILSLAGKFGISTAFSILYLYTAELYPTAIRNTAVGMCSMMARLGGVLAPLVAWILPKLTFDEMPLLVMGTCALFGGFLSLFLPETLGSPLLEEVNDINVLFEIRKPFFSWWGKQRFGEELKIRMDALEKQRNANDTK